MSSQDLVTPLFIKKKKKKKKKQKTKAEIGNASKYVPSFTQSIILCPITKDPVSVHREG